MFDSALCRRSRPTGLGQAGPPRSRFVSALRPAQVLPDSAAHFRGEAPEHVYSVDFDSHDLWGPDGEQFSLTIDLYESYVEASA